MHRHSFVVLTGLIVLTLLSCQGPADLTKLFASATPTATSTFTPSPIPSQTPTPTPTLTFTPVPTGTTMQIQSDGSIVFIDYDNKYEVDFPKGWAVSDLKADDLDNLFNLAAKDDPRLEHTIMMLGSMNPMIFRVFAFDFQPDHLVSGFTITVNIIAENDNVSKAMSLEDLVDGSTQSLPHIYKGAKILSSMVTTSGSNMPIGQVDLTVPMDTDTGGSVMIYQRAVFIKLPQQNVITITLVTPVSLQRTLLTIFNQIIDSFKIL